MGAKTVLLAYAAQDAVQILRAQPGDTGREAAEALLRRVHPDWRIDQPVGANAVSDLSESVYPPENVAYAAHFPGLEIVCDRHVMAERPSRLPQHYLDAAEGRTAVLHAMHSVSDALAFAVWKGGKLARSLRLSPHGGIVENIGEPLPFEEPFWAGEHPVTPIAGWPSKGPYPLPFHPLTLGGAALRALLGFVLEGRREPGDIDASTITMHGFALTPTGPTLEQRRAAREALAARMGPRRSLYLQPDGSWAETPASPQGTTT